MMFRERPECREMVLRLCRERGLTPRELFENYKYQLSDGLKTQCRKMIEEENDFNTRNN